MNGERFVLSPTGPLNRCEDDVRRFFDAAEAGIKRALKSGARKPLLLVVPDERFSQSLLVSILGAMHALYTTLELREATKDAVFYRTYPLLYPKFENMVIFRSGNLYTVFTF